MTSNKQMLIDLHATEALKVGDLCEFRFPARSEWHSGKVVENGGSGFWAVSNTNEIPADSEHNVAYRAGGVHRGLYIEHVRAAGTDPWGDK